ncbi:helix-turn-helix domain-containing protein [Acinetobacter boissieri]|uniref:Helix-turn-helix n=1 Tax=Acinetobacter boissieri TaxID=1219383 RepID=A0A1G6GYX4_9GAMM|nr:helix-turn-helix transcriptional regulator [Acinetobacter boissieri]SDB87257.1 Helix-turn-helix [Acinetobacter boissieri]
MSTRIPTEDRQQLLIQTYIQYLTGQLSQGELLQYLRKSILGLTQQQYATLVNVSRRTLTNIEQNQGHQTQQVLDKVFKPLGLKTGLIPTHAHIIDKVLHGNK